MRIGAMTELITIEKPTESQSKTGAITTSWTTLGTVWAEKLDISGREYVQGQQTESLISTRFRIYYRSDITGKMRIKHGDNYYSIEAALDQEGRKRELHLMCKEAG
jgi:SPP1 family predicted phage head-tail adaptor